MEKRGRRGREESSVAFHLLIDIAVAIDVASLVLPSSHSREPQAEAHPVCAASSATSLSPHANNAIADEGFVLSVTPPSPRRVCDLRSAEAQLGKLGIASQLSTSIALSLIHCPLVVVLHHCHVCCC
jgi:hypothetical protein